MKGADVAIAKAISRHPSTVGLRRNSAPVGYDEADRQATERRSTASAEPRDPRAVGRGQRDVGATVETRSRGACDGRFTVSHEWIYRRVRDDKEAGGKLASAAPRQEAHAPEARQAAAAFRVGWTYVRRWSTRSPGSGTGKATRAPATGVPCCRWWTVPRSSRCWPCGRTAEETAACRCLEPVKEFVHTVTHGKEFAAHGRVAKFLETLFFFAQPYHSWERGLNEHTNGLVRQYKTTDFREVDPLARVEDLLNNRPRKAPPMEVFREATAG